MGKITVTHYLNKRLKESMCNGVIEYSVYLRASYGRKHEQIKSDWIVHPCSENDFINDKNIIELKKYESEIAYNIIEKSKDFEFNLRSRLNHSKKSIPNIFLENMFDRYEVKDQIIGYISEKADISKSILCPYFKGEHRPEEWFELSEKGVFCDTTKEKVLYLSILLEFEEIKYPPLSDNILGYRAGCIFIPHEWNYKNIEQSFIEFAKEKNILSHKQLEVITKEFNNKLQHRSSLGL